MNNTFIPFFFVAQQLSLSKKSIRSDELIFSHCGYPNDPLFPQQFHMINDGQFYGIPGEDIGISNILLYRNYTGKNINIVVHDNGLRIDHNDIIHSINVDILYNYRNNSQNVEPIDLENDFHGTACAGIIASNWNSLCGAGIAPDSKIGATLSMFSGSTYPILYNSLLFKPDLVDIHSCSYMLNPCTLDLCYAPAQIIDIKDIIRSQSVNGKNGRGCVYVFSAGNDGVLMGDPNFQTIGNWKEVICVGSTTNRGQHAFYSSVGCCLLINTPSGLTSSDLYEIGGNKPLLPTIHSNGIDSCFKSFSGTSASAPIVSGVISLLYESNIELTPREISIILARTATINDPKHISWVKNAAGVLYSDHYGFGRIHSERALNCAKNWTRIETQKEVSGEYSQETLLNRINGDFTSVMINLSELYVENIELSIKLQCNHYSLLRIILKSPMGSIAIVKQLSNLAEDSNMITRFITVRNFFGENSFGQWEVIFQNCGYINTGVVYNVKISAFGTNKANNHSCFGNYYGIDPYQYEWPKPVSFNIKSVSKEIVVGKSIEIEFEGNSLNCLSNVFLEDTTVSTRFYLGNLIDSNIGKVSIPVKIPIIPDNWKGSIVLESFKCNWTVKQEIFIVKNDYSVGLKAKWNDYSKKIISIEWHSNSSSLPLEGSFVIVEILDGANLHRWRYINNGFMVLSDYQHHNETALITVSNAYCSHPSQCWVYSCSYVEKESSFSTLLYVFAIIGFISCVIVFFVVFCKFSTKETKSDRIIVNERDNLMDE